MSFRRISEKGTIEVDLVMDAEERAVLDRRTGSIPACSHGCMDGYEYEYLEWEDGDGAPCLMGVWRDKELEALEAKIMELAYEVALLVYKGLDHGIPLLGLDGHPVDISFCLGRNLPSYMACTHGYKLDGDFLDGWVDSMRFLALLFPGIDEDKLNGFISW